MRALFFTCLLLCCECLIKTAVASEKSYPPLRYAALHQDPDGRWNADASHLNCPDSTGHPAGEDVFGADSDLVVSSYALLSYLTNGYDHRTPNRWRKQIKKGLHWLLQQQQANGRFSSTIWIHAIATATLAEAYAMTVDPILKQPTAKAIQVILTDQIQYADQGWGWPQQADTGSTLCESRSSLFAIMALKTAKAGGLETEDGLPHARRWFTAAFHAQNGSTDTFDRTKTVATFPRFYSPETKIAHEPLPYYGPTAAVYLGMGHDSIIAETLANGVMNTLDAQQPIEDLELLWLNTIAIFQVGGERWRRWNKHFRDRAFQLISTEENCLHGSVDPQGKAAPYQKLGRVSCTALMDLYLSVYWKYIPITPKK